MRANLDLAVTWEVCSVTPFGLHPVAEFGTWEEALADAARRQENSSNRYTTRLKET